MPKTILIFSDGTGQAGGLKPDQHLSNVYKLFRATRVGPDSPVDPAAQIAFYDAGLGTKKENQRRWRRFHGRHRLAIQIHQKRRRTFGMAALQRCRRGGRERSQGSSMLRLLTHGRKEAGTSGLFSASHFCQAAQRLMRTPSRLRAGWRGFSVATSAETRRFTCCSVTRELQGAAFGQIRSRCRPGEFRRTRHVRHIRCMSDGFASEGGESVNNIIYIVGLVVIVIAVLSWLGLR